MRFLEALFRIAQTGWSVMGASNAIRRRCFVSMKHDGKSTASAVPKGNEK
jgi:hypothetical protein